MGSNGKLGPYELLDELGHGAMARVWRAWDPNLEREVAIKEPLFDQDLSSGLTEEMGRRFVSEGRIAARLAHPGIVTIYAADVWEGRPGIVMELIRGETLAQHLRRERMAPSDSFAILDQLLDAVGYAHAQGVVHRDIKPDNIFLTNDGRVKLADFGIARMDGSMATIAGSVLGTPGYMSPEQATGGDVDQRSDIFSVGVVAYELFAGRNPFGAGEGTDATTLIYRIVHEEPLEMPKDVSAGLPVDVRPAIMAALAKRPADRPQSAEEFRSMLYGASRDRNRSTAVSSRLRPAPTERRSPTPWMPYAVVALIGVAAIGFMLFGATGTGGGGVASTSSEQVASSTTDDEDKKDKTTSETAGDQAEDVKETSTSESEAEQTEKVEDGAVSEPEANQVESGQEDSGDGASTSEVVETPSAEPVEQQDDSEYILPESNTRYYTREELEPLSNWELWMARNEIYARNGRMFDNEEAQDYFNSKSWYEGRYTPYEFDKGGVPKVYNDYERANRDLIIEIETERGSSYAR